MEVAIEGREEDGELRRRADPMREEAPRREESVKGPVQFFSREGWNPILASMLVSLLKGALAPVVAWIPSVATGDEGAATGEGLSNPQFISFMLHCISEFASVVCIQKQKEKILLYQNTPRMK